MRVILLTHYYPPEAGAPQVRISTLARLLVERGAEVTVHTGFPNYPDGRIASPYRNRPYLVEADGGHRVVRSAVYPAPNRGIARRLANHASFALSALAAAPLSGAADVVVAESPPLFTAAAGVAYARAKRAQLVLNVADQWPRSAVELGMLRQRSAVRAASWIERRCYRAATAITVPTDGLVASVAAIPEASGKVVRIGPSVDTSRFRVAPRRTAGVIRVLYAGTVGLAQGVDTLVDAARIAGPETVEIWIAGDGAEAADLRRRIAGEGLANVRMLGSVPHDVMPKIYAEVDAVAVLLRDRPVFSGALPTKLVEAMAAGRPVVLSARGEAADLVSETGAGVVVPPEDAGALATTLSELGVDEDRRRHLGEAGRLAAVEHFDWDRSAERWWDLLQSVAENGRAVTSSGRAQASASPRRAG